MPKLKAAVSSDSIKKRLPTEKELAMNRKYAI